MSELHDTPFRETPTVDEEHATRSITLFPEAGGIHALRVYLWDAVISGRGLIWLGSGFVTAPDLMPKYWKDRLENWNPEVRPDRNFALPVREVHEPCISAVGWGSHIYGHVLIEVIPRLLLGLMAAKEMGIRPRVLMRLDSPAWVETLLVNHLAVAPDQIEVFDPAREKVRLVNGLIPTYVVSPASGFHPATARLLDGVRALPDPTLRNRRVYLTRRRLPVEQHRWRSCENEAELGDIASREFGFEEVAPEMLPWPNQVRLFRESNAVCGLHGSALHTAIFAEHALQIGVVGHRNREQTHIAELRGHQIHYFESGQQSGVFRVDPDAFRRMLSRMLEGD